MIQLGLGKRQIGSVPFVRRSGTDVSVRPLKNRIGEFLIRSSPLRARCSMPQPLGSMSETTVAVTINASVCADWPARDPIGERGGINIYSFVRNKTLRFVDAIGLVLFDVDFDETDDVIAAMLATVAHGQYRRPTSYMRDEMTGRTEDVSRSLDCGCSFPWIRTKCTVRGTYKNTSLPGIIYMSMWLPLGSPTPEEQAAFDDIYNSVLQHELQHNALDESFFSLLNAGYVGQGSACSLSSAMACEIAQADMIAAHDKNFERIMLDSAHAEWSFELSDAHHQFTRSLYGRISHYKEQL